MDPNEFDMNDSSLSEYGAGGMDDQAALPLGVGGFDSGGDPLIGMADESGKNRAGQLLIVLVIVVAVAGLFFMRTLAKVTIAAVSADTEKLLEDFLDDRKNNSPAEGIADLREKSLSVLNDPYPDLQRPLESLKKNPFDGTTEKVDIDIPENIDDGEIQYIRAVKAKEQAFERAISSLKLKSVLGGSNPVANISGNIVRTDDSVMQDGIMFIVKMISGDSVTLEAREEALALIRKYTLEIDRP